MVGLIQCTSPFVRVEHLNEALAKITAGSCDSVFSVTRSHSLRWMQVDDDDGKERTTLYRAFSFPSSSSVPNANAPTISEIFSSLCLCLDSPSVRQLSFSLLLLCRGDEYGRRDPCGELWSSLSTQKTRLGRRFSGKWSLLLCYGTTLASRIDSRGKVSRNKKCQQ